MVGLLSQPFKTDAILAFFNGPAVRFSNGIHKPYYVNQTSLDLYDMSGIWIASAHWKSKLLNVQYVFKCELSDSNQMVW